MNITITGSLGNIGRRLTAKLIASGHTVTVISSNDQRADEIRQLQAIPAIGSVSDAAFLQQVFTGADAVFTMVPPDFSVPDHHTHIRETAARYAQAIATAGVKYVVNLSSVGAHTPEGAGPSGAHYHVEQQLNALTVTNILHIRPGMFYTNFLGAVPVVKQHHMLGNNFDAAVSAALTHPEDIASAAAAYFNAPVTGKHIRYVVSDVRTGGEIAATLGRAIGMPELPWVSFPDEAMLQSLVQSGMTTAAASFYIIEIGKALRNGSLLEDFLRQQHQAGGQSLEAFAKEFAQVYHA